MGELIRTFISIEIPVTESIRGLLADLNDIDNIRPVPVSQLHITLKFMGDTYSDKIPKLGSKLNETFEDVPQFEVCMKGVGAFPKINNPRVIWIGFERCDELTDAAEKVESSLRSLRLQFDEKKFSPHVTVGRVNGQTDIKGLVSKYKDTEFCRFTCKEIRIMKSELSLKGAKHTVLETIRLK